MAFFQLESRKDSRSQHCFQRDHYTVVLHDSPRLLVVHTKPAGCSIVFFNTHAPHNGTDELEKNRWWGELERLLQKYRQLGHIFCLGDFNARLGDVAEGHVGNRLCDHTSDNGHRLLGIMERHGLWAPSTFEDFHSGVDYSWTHPKGTTARLDFILCGSTSGLFVDESYVDLDVQTSLPVRDHELVVLDCRIYKDTSCLRPPNKRFYDWSLMQTEWGKQKLNEIVQSLPDVPWEEDVHVHWQLLEDGLHAGLGEFFSGRQRPKRLDIFSEQTRTSLSSRRSAKQGLIEYDNVIQELQKRCALESWTDGALLQDGLDRRGLLFQCLEMCRLFFLSLFRKQSQKLKLQVKQDKATYIQDVVCRANGTSGPDIYQALKPLRIGGKARRFGIPPLPGFEEGGEMARSDAEADSIW